MCGIQLLRVQVGFVLIEYRSSIRAVGERGPSEGRRSTVRAAAAVEVVEARSEVKVRVAEIG